MLQTSVRSNSRGRTILVTGFGAFPGAPRNPTQAIVAALGRHRPRLQRLGVNLHVAVLPVRFAAIDEALADLAARHKPDVIMHLGVASRRRRLSVETRALNRSGPLHPDASGCCPAQILVPGGPSSLRATYPAPRILAALRKSGVAAERSIDAGDYVCNATLFRSLLAPAAAEIGFLHVPKARSGVRPLHRVRHPGMPVAAMTQAILIAILALAPRRDCSLQAKHGGRGGPR